MSVEIPFPSSSSSSGDDGANSDSAPCRLPVQQRTVGAHVGGGEAAACGLWSDSAVIGRQWASTR